MKIRTATPYFLSVTLRARRCVPFTIAKSVPNQESTVLAAYRLVDNSGIFSVS
jgi:hypothetical protein